MRFTTDSLENRRQSKGIAFECALRAGRPQSGLAQGEIPIAQAADVSGTVECDWGMGDSVNELSGKAAASADPDQAWGAAGLAPASASGGVLFSLLAGEEDLGSASVCAGVSLWRQLRPKEPTSRLYVVDMARRIGSLNG
jgi:hypothetical protein